MNAFSLLNRLSVVVAPIIARVAAGTLSSSGAWRPPEWSRPAVTTITVPGSGSGLLSTSGAGSTKNKLLSRITSAATLAAQTVPGVVAALSKPPTVNLITDSDVKIPGNWTLTWVGSMTLVPGAGAEGGNGWVYIGTGSPSGFLFPSSAPITVTPGVTYTISGYMDATAIAGGGNVPTWSVYNTSITTSYCYCGALAGAKGRYSGSFVCPAGLTQVVIIMDTNNCTVAAGQKFIASDPQFEATATQTPYSPNLPNPNGRQWLNLTNLPGVVTSALSLFDKPTQDMQSAGSGTVYVFDATLKVDHHRALRRTEHPIQTSGSSPVGSITDHAFALPARVTLEIGMSDAMDSYAPVWTGASTKSVSAFQTLITLQQSRTLVTLTTRLATYSNMIIESVLPSDTSKTTNGLRATVVFSEVFMAQATAVHSTFLPVSGDSSSNVGDDDGTPASDRPQTTASTGSGTVQRDAVPDAVSAQHQITSAVSSALPSALQLIPGAGRWSSVNVNQLGGLFS